MVKKENQQYERIKNMSPLDKKRERIIVYYSRVFQWASVVLMIISFILSVFISKVWVLAFLLIIPILLIAGFTNIAKLENIRIAFNIKFKKNVQEYFYWKKYNAPETNKLLSVYLSYLNEEIDFIELKKKIEKIHSEFLKAANGKISLAQFKQNV